MNRNPALNPRNGWTVHIDGLTWITFHNGRETHRETAETQREARQEAYRYLKCVGAFLD